MSDVSAIVHMGGRVCRNEGCKNEPFLFGFCSAPCQSEHEAKTNRRRMWLSDELLTGEEHGNNLKLFYADWYDQFDPHELRLFCHHYARYGLPTIELIAWLKEQIGSRSAIEIGAGSGDLGCHLGIPMTDNYNQQMPDVKAVMALASQPTIQYGKDVEKLDALDAQAKYRPEVIVGCWVTQWIDPNLPPPPGGGNVYGIKETELLERLPPGGSYIVIGAHGIHDSKKIMTLPHETYELPFLRSRRTDNVVQVWNKPKVTVEVSK